MDWFSDHGPVLGRGPISMSRITERVPSLHVEDRFQLKTIVLDKSRLWSYLLIHAIIDLYVLLLSCPCSHWVVDAFIELSMISLRCTCSYWVVRALINLSMFSLSCLWSYLFVHCPRILFMQHILMGSKKYKHMNSLRVAHRHVWFYVVCLVR